MLATLHTEIEKAKSYLFFITSHQQTMWQSGISYLSSKVLNNIWFKQNNKAENIYHKRQTHKHDIS